MLYNGWIFYLLHVEIIRKIKLVFSVRKLSIYTIKIYKTYYILYPVLAFIIPLSYIMHSYDILDLLMGTMTFFATLFIKASFIIITDDTPSSIFSETFRSVGYNFFAFDKIILIFVPTWRLEIFAGLILNDKNSESPQINNYLLFTILNIFTFSIFCIRLTRRSKLFF